MLKIKNFINFFFPRLMLDTGGGGGGTTIPAVTQQTTISDLPDWAKNYTFNLLGRAQPLSEALYSTYGAQRVAGLSPLQQQAVLTAGSPGQFGLNVQGYMSPYQQAVTDIQKREATRQFGIQSAAQQAQATQAGAFGGSRQAVLQAEGQRNLAQQLNDIQAQGSQAAYQQAAQQANLATNQQMQLGALQQQIAQKGMDVAYGDYLAQQNFPYQQLSFMSNLLRGTPMGMNTASQVYQPGPTTAQTIGSLGLGAYGLSQLMGSKEGGLMKSYADGGEVQGYAGDEGSVTSEGFERSQLEMMNPEQLMTVRRNAMARRDMGLAQLVDEVMAENQSMQAGLGNAFNTLPAEQQESIVQAAGGGILAFDEGGDVEYDPTAMFQSRGDPRLNRIYGDKMLEVISRMERSPGYVPMTRDQLREAEREEYENLTRFAGQDPYAPMRKRLEEDEASRGRALEEGKGIAALQAANAMLQPGGTIRGLGAAGAAFGTAYGQALRADRAEKRYLGQMQFNLADAERKERMGLTKEARAAVQAAEQAKLNAVKARIQSDQAIGNMLGKGMQATRTVGGAGAGAGNKEWTYATKTYLPLAKQEHPDASPAELEAYAYQMYQQGRGPGLAGAQGRIESAEQKNKEDQVKDDLFANREYRQAKRKGDTDTTDRIENAARQRRGLPPLGGAAPAEAPKGPKVGTVQQGYRYKGGDPSKESSWEKV